MPQFTCRQCGSPLPDGTFKCPNCGKNNAEDDVIKTFIPHNTFALLSYYFGVFSLLCVPLGILPIIFGVLGLSYAKKNPEAKGAVHAWVGIILGFIETALTIAAVVFMMNAQ